MAYIQSDIDRYRPSAEDPAEVDVIMLSLGDTPERRAMTNQALNTLFASERHVQFNVVVVEDYRNFLKEGLQYENCMVVVPGSSVVFNYNLFLQYGLKYSDSYLRPDRWVVLANNDLIFHSGWMSEIIAMGKYKDMSSFGVWDDTVHNKRFAHTPASFIEGYRTSFEWTGWCQVMKRRLIDKINQDPNVTRVKFWYSDNVYRDHVKAMGERHALLRDAKVTHLESATIRTFDHLQLKEYTHGQTKKYHA